MNRMGWAISVFLLVGGAFVVWEAMQEPAQTGHVMTSTDTSAMSEGDPIANVKVPEELSFNATLGKRIFDGNCAACHGANGAGKNGAAPPLVHKIYEPSHHGDYSFVLAAKNGVRSHHWKFGNMPPVEVDEGDVKLVVLYIRELQRENGIE